MENLPVETEGQPASHLAVRLERPKTGIAGDLAVLYMHGFGSDQSGTKAEFFRRAALELGIAFCSFDFQGHGISGGTMLGLTQTRNVEDIGRVHGHLRAQGFRRIVLMGSSMGGGSALWYAALNPVDVVAAVHVAPSMGLHEALLRWVGPKAAKRWEREGRIVVQHELGEQELSWDLIEDFRSYRTERLESIYRTPTLIFQGKKDASVPWRSVLDFVVGCEWEGIELHLMADADHRLLDRLEHVWRLIVAFLVHQGLVEGRA